MPLLKNNCYILLASQLYIEQQGSTTHQEVEHIHISFYLYIDVKFIYSYIDIKKKHEIQKTS